MVLTNILATELLSSTLLAYSNNTVFSFDDVTFVQSHYANAYNPSSNNSIIGFYDGYQINGDYFSYDVLRFYGTDYTNLVNSYAYNHSSTVTQVAASTFYYNCHTFAWLYEGDINLVPNNTSDLYVMNYPSSLYKYNQNYNCAGGSYTHFDAPSQISSTSFINVGDIIVYYDPVDQSSNTIVHSAVVIQTAQNIEDVVVIGKWGVYGVYVHTIFDCPYYVPAISAGSQSTTESDIDICNVNHTKVYDRATAAYHFYKTTCCG